MFIERWRGGEGEGGKGKAKGERVGRGFEEKGSGVLGGGSQGITRTGNKRGMRVRMADKRKRHEGNKDEEEEEAVGGLAVGVS